MTPLENFVELITDYTQIQGISVNQFAKRANIPQRPTSRWLNFGYFPSTKYTIAIADFFQCSVDYLFGLVDTAKYIPSTKTDTFYHRFCNLCAKNHATSYKVGISCGIGNSITTKWKYGVTPRIETLIALAAFFHCSIDYLICRSDFQ